MKILVKVIEELRQGERKLTDDEKEELISIYHMIVTIACGISIVISYLIQRDTLEYNFILLIGLSIMLIGVTLISISILTLFGIHEYDILLLIMVALSLLFIINALCLGNMAYTNSRVSIVENRGLELRFRR